MEGSARKRLLSSYYAVLEQPLAQWKPRLHTPDAPMQVHFQGTRFCLSPCVMCPPSPVP